VRGGQLEADAGGAFSQAELMAAEARTADPGRTSPIAHHLPGRHPPPRPAQPGLCPVPETITSSPPGDLGGSPGARNEMPAASVQSPIEGGASGEAGLTDRSAAGRRGHHGRYGLRTRRLHVCLSGFLSGRGMPHGLDQVRHERGPSPAGPPEPPRGPPAHALGSPAARRPGHQQHRRACDHHQRELRSRTGGHRDAAGRRAYARRGQGPQRRDRGPDPGADHEHRHRGARLPRAPPGRQGHHPTGGPAATAAAGSVTVAGPHLGSVPPDRPPRHPGTTTALLSVRPRPPQRRLGPGATSAAR